MVQCVETQKELSRLPEAKRQSWKSEDNKVEAVDRATPVMSNWNQKEKSF